MNPSRREFMALLGAAGLAGCAQRTSLVRPKATSGAFGMLRGPAVPDDSAQFIASLKGHAVRPQDEGYDPARRLWNAAYDDRRPSLIAFCAGAEDVARSIEFARERNLRATVRAGGHSLAGCSSCDGGLIIDVSLLKSVSIDPGARVIRCGSGLLLGEFDRATALHGLATTSGTEPTTGIAGLTLGGGLGWLMGKYGLACDNLRSVELVLADGRIVTASSKSNEDLFWAMRGAGANFGVVTSMEYDLHPVRNIYGGVLKYPHESLRAVLTHYRDFVADMPDEVGLSIGTIPNPEGPALVSLAVCYCGDAEDGERALRPLRSLSPCLSDDITTVPYVEFQQRGGLPPGLRLGSFTRSSWMTDLSDSAIDVVVRHMKAAPIMGGNFVIERVHGEATRKAPGDTAFPYRGAAHNFSLHATWVDPGARGNAKKWGHAFWEEMRPIVGAGVYSNYLESEGKSRARDSYGVNYPRLSDLKRKFDPTNFFASNQNIEPSV